MGILSIISILFTISLVFARNGSKTYKYLTAQSLVSEQEPSMVQIAYLLFDIQLCFITCPHLMMQQLTGYTLGILTLSAKWQFVAILFCLIQMFSSAYICIIFRHQSILPFKSSLKLHSRLKWMMTFFAFDLGHCAMCISVALAIKNAVEDESSPPWLLNRNSIFIPWSIFAIWAFLHITGALLFLIGLVSFTFWHMNYTLKETRKFLSPTTAYLQRLAVIALAAQKRQKVALLQTSLAIQCSFSLPIRLSPLSPSYSPLRTTGENLSPSIERFPFSPLRRYFFRYFSNR
ncbi:hypothetical protein PMAYCL1PPCAC_17598, partial [Pristionchus mayeri]